jgi:signal transduction histidine kinase
LQENLRRLDRLANLGLVSASIAHEIKNGLVAINTFVELLLEKGEDQEMAEVVQRELRRIDALATQMLRLSSPKPAALHARCASTMCSTIRCGCWNTR